VKLVVGLGNPGPRYARTRHNVGFRVLESLAARLRVPLDPVEELESRFAREAWDDLEVGLLAPETFMNLSGGPVAAAVRALPVEDPSRDLLVVYDDLDLPLGRLRLRARGGAGGHNGLGDILEALGEQAPGAQDTSALPRLRFGIGRPPPGMDPVDYVLAPFTKDEESSLRRALPRAVDAVICFLEEGAGPAMNRFNADAP